MKILAQLMGTALTASKKPLLALATVLVVAGWLPATDVDSNALVPTQGILHGIVTRQGGGPPLTHLTAHVTLIQGTVPFNEKQRLSTAGEFIFDPYPGTYLVELRGKNGKVVASQTDVPIFSDITTFVFFDL